MKLTIVKKNLLSWTAMHIDFVMCNKLNTYFTLKSAKKIIEMLIIENIHNTTPIKNQLTSFLVLGYPIYLNRKIFQYFSRK